MVDLPLKAQIYGNNTSSALSWHLSATPFEAEAVEIHTTKKADHCSVELPVDPGSVGPTEPVYLDGIWAWP